MEKQERLKRVVARGEISGHSHVIIGGELVEKNGRLYVVSTEDNQATIKHLVEKAWVEEERQEWTGEHLDILISPGIYEIDFVHQLDPMTRLKSRVVD